MSRRRINRQRSVRLTEATARTASNEYGEAARRPLWGRPRGVSGGPRVAYSYLIGVLAGLIGGGVGWAVAAQLYESGAVCRGDDSLSCPFTAFAGLALVLLAAVLFAGAWWAGLGALWALWCIALSLGLFELVGDPSSSWLLLILLVPAAASLLTDPTARGMSRRRRWITLGLGLGILLQFLIASYLALR